MGSKVILDAETHPVPAPHAQRMKLPARSDADVVYSTLFLCMVSNLIAAALTAGISLE